MMINISGTEGVGKTLASGIIQETLEDMGVKFAKTREPGGTPIAEEIRRLLKDFMSEETFHPMTELLLFYGARYQLFKNLILPELKQGSVIISDRSYACTFAYQVRASGVISEDDFWTVHNLVMKDMPTYDLIFIFLRTPWKRGLKEQEEEVSLTVLSQMILSSLSEQMRVTESSLGITLLLSLSTHLPTALPPLGRLLKKN